MRMNFVARPDMLASELDHFVTKPIPLPVALNMVGRLGVAHLEKPSMSTWYFAVELMSYHGRDADGKRLFLVQADFPMSLMVNMDGTAYLRHKVGDTRHIDAMVRTLTPVDPAREDALLAIAA
jgi:hypothetical protein